MNIVVVRPLEYARLMRLISMLWTVLLPTFGLASSVHSFVSPSSVDGVAADAAAAAVGGGDIVPMRRNHGLFRSIDVRSDSMVDGHNR